MGETQNRFVGPSGEVLITNGSVEGDQFLRAYQSACREQQEDLASWRSALRQQGVFVTSPDDGWVKRERNEWLPPSYAHIGGPLEIGTVVALGTPGAYRLVTIVGIRDNGLFPDMKYYRFVPFKGTSPITAATS